MSLLPYDRDGAKERFALLLGGYRLRGDFLGTESLISPFLRANSLTLFASIMPYQDPKIKCLRLCGIRSIIEAFHP